MCVLFYSSFVYISAYANVYFQTIFNQHSCVWGPLRECRSIRSGASGLPYYCAPLVCVSEVIELLAVWRHNKPKTKNPTLIKQSNKHWKKQTIWKEACIVSVPVGAVKHEYQGEGATRGDPGKIPLANEHNSAPTTSTSERGLACTSARHPGHPARAGVFSSFQENVW